MNPIEARGHAKGYEDGYKASESDMAELLKDKQRLDWILNSYTLSCGITREEVDVKMTELLNSADELWYDLLN